MGRGVIAARPRPSPSGVFYDARFHTGLAHLATGDSYDSGVAAGDAPGVVAGAYRIALALQPPAAPTSVLNVFKARVVEIAALVGQHHAVQVKLEMWGRHCWRASAANPCTPWRYGRGRSSMQWSRRSQWGRRGGWRSMISYCDVWTKKDRREGRSFFMLLRESALGDFVDIDIEHQLLAGLDVFAAGFWIPLLQLFDADLELLRDAYQ